MGLMESVTLKSGHHHARGAAAASARSNNNNKEELNIYWYDVSKNKMKVVNPLYEKIHSCPSTDSEPDLDSSLSSWTDSLTSLDNLSIYGSLSSLSLGSTLSIEALGDESTEEFDTFAERYGPTNENNCSYTCHERCVDLVTLDCKTQSTDLNSELVEVNCERGETVSWSGSLKGPELRLRVEQYNVTTPGFEMEMQEDCETFHGFIRVHMNLSRPINVVAGTRPPSMYNIIYDDDEDIVKTLTSFYLPRDTVKALHITSDTTAREVISGLLKKFKVIDNPLKFCLYEKSWDGEGSCKVTMRRLYDREKPLWLPLKWAADDLQNRKLVLQENDTGDIAWDEFSLPELNNFLKILDREEEEYLNQVRMKYRLLTDKLGEAMQYSQQAADKKLQFSIEHV